MDAFKTKRMREMREKIVSLLLSNPNHTPSCQCVKSGGREPMYSRPLDDSTIGLASNLIKYIETANDESSTYESIVIED